MTLLRIIKVELKKLMTNKRETGQTSGDCSGDGYFTVKATGFGFYPL